LGIAGIQARMRLRGPEKGIKPSVWLKEDVFEILMPPLSEVKGFLSSGSSFGESIVIYLQ